ncbi:hypothetical protein [Streptomyces sp. SID12501]|nr:hypothetical protein [Streptomyces sp. SID12501]
MARGRALACRLRASTGLGITTVIDPRAGDLSAAQVAEPGIPGP